MVAWLRYNDTFVKTVGVWLFSEPCCTSTAWTSMRWHDGGRVRAVEQASGAPRIAGWLKPLTRGGKEERVRAPTPVERSFPATLSAEAQRRLRLPPPSTPGGPIHWR